MVRISPKLVRQAAASSRLLVPLLKANRSVARAKQELKWIQQELPPSQWSDAVLRRSNLEPLQYILQSQPFGSLDIKCRPGVLIPRWETEEWTTKLASVLCSQSAPVNIVDACTGTGCIPLLLSHELQDNGIPSEITAFDVTQDAINLALENAHQNNLLVQIKYGDVFNKNLITDLKISHLIDLITSNPPYIPYEDYISSVQLNGVEKSVRMYEPSLALIGGNEFYRALIENLVMPTSAKGFVFELGYVEQANHVQQLLKSNTQWKVDHYYDSANNIRCVIGWKKDTNMAVLQSLCNDRN